MINLIVRIHLLLSPFRSIHLSISLSTYLLIHIALLHKTLITSQNYYRHGHGRRLGISDPIQLAFPHVEHLTIIPCKKLCRFRASPGRLCY